MTLRTMLPRCLIVAAVGDQSLHRYWSTNRHGDFDTYLIYYGDGEGYEGESKYYRRQKGSKYQLIADTFESSPELLENYHYLWFPDDDIYMRRPEINKMFAFQRDFQLWLCQPSIMGFYGLAITLPHFECRLRYTNYVEITCPFFTREALTHCLPTFRENKSGWGIDALWNVKLGHPRNRIAIVDEIVAVHTRPVGYGDIYKKEVGNISQAQQEAAELHKKYNLAESNYKDLAYGKAVSQENFGLLYFNTIEYGRVHRPMEATLDCFNRMWPFTEETRAACKKIRDERPPAPDKPSSPDATAYGLPPQNE